MQEQTLTTKPIVPPQPRLGGALEPKCQWTHKTRNDLKAKVTPFAIPMAGCLSQVQREQ